MTKKQLENLTYGLMTTIWTLIVVIQWFSNDIFWVKVNMTIFAFFMIIFVWQNLRTLKKWKESNNSWYELSKCSNRIFSEHLKNCKKSKNNMVKGGKNKR